MGRQVAANYGNSKHQMVASTVAAALVAGATDEVILWVGDTALTRMTEAKSRAIKCLNAYIENGAIVPTALQFGTYHCGIDESTATVATDGAVPTLAETDVALVIGDTFHGSDDGSSQYADAFFRQALDLLLEDRKDA